MADMDELASGLEASVSAAAHIDTLACADKLEDIDFAAGLQRADEFLYGILQALAELRRRAEHGFASDASTR